VTEQDRALLLSVRPHFAEKIITGAKSAEIRRQRLGVQPGTPVVIYATLPTAALIGTAQIAAVSSGRPAELWAVHHDQVGLSREEYDSYLEGASVAYILTLTDARRLHAPLTLSHLRAAADFQPPRSFQYLTRDRLHELVDGHPGGGPLLDLIPSDQSAEDSLFPVLCTNIS
jgi:predicted transcriptional regulator